MIDNQVSGTLRQAALAALAAELTTAAYSVALRHGPGNSWVDLELELWRVLVAAVDQWQQRLSETALPGTGARRPQEAKGES
jgi:hypothetical protein